MRGKSNLAAMMLAALAATHAVGPPPSMLTLTPGGNHRRVATGLTGVLKTRRAARKARNVKANRRNHRG